MEGLDLQAVGQSYGALLPIRSMTKGSTICIDDSHNVKSLRGSIIELVATNFGQ